MVGDPRVPLQSCPNYGIPKIPKSGQDLKMLDLGNLGMFEFMNAVNSTK